MGYIVLYNLNKLDGYNAIWEIQSHVFIPLSTFWSQSEDNYIHPLFNQWVVTLQVSIPFCEMHLCRKLCFIISYHTSGTPCLTHQPPSLCQVMPPYQGITLH